MGADSFGPYEALTLQDHSRWRPEWRTDRVMVWWYLTFRGLPDVRPLCSEIQGALGHLDNLDLLPLEWLHLTLDDIGFDDELPPERLEALVAAAARSLASWRPLRVVLSAPTTMEDALVLQAFPPLELSKLRATLHDAVASVAGPGALTAEPSADFWPHVSLGYVNRECTQHDILSHLPAELADAMAVVAVDTVTLAAVSRADRSYSWTVLAEIPLGAGAERPQMSVTHVSQ